MTDVIAWPPVGLVAWEFTRVDPVSRSVGLLDGRPRTSSAQRSRRLATAQVSGFGPDKAGAGYIEVLKQLLAGGRNLVRVECRSSISPLVSALNLQNIPMVWTAGGNTMVWYSGGDELQFRDYPNMTGTPTTDGGWPALSVTGLPPNQIVARPSDLITVESGGTSQDRRALTVARSNASGAATIRVLDAFTISGPVGIGRKESIVFEALEMPRAVQPLTGDYSYEWAFREVFADEFSDGWTEKNPWD